NTAHAIAKINHVNAKKKDGFIEAMVAQRADLRGVPFLMGDDCRMNEEQAKWFNEVVTMVRSGLREANAGSAKGENPDKLWEGMRQINTLMIQGGNLDSKTFENRANQDQIWRST